MIALLLTVFTHMAITVDDWRRSGHQDKDAECGVGKSTGSRLGETSPSHLCARTVRTSDKLYRNDTNHVVQGIYQRRARRIDGGDWRGLPDR